MKVFFHVMDLVGPQNACIGLGQELHKRGHQVHFLINCKFEYRFVKYSSSFVLHLLKPAENGETRDDPIKSLTNRLSQIGFFDALPPIEKVKMLKLTTILPKLFENGLKFEPQIKRLLEEEKPDVILIDSEIMAPILMNSGIPWIYLYCCNPIGLFDSPHLPPFMSDFRVNSDPSEWKKFEKSLNQDYFFEVTERQRRLCRHFGYPEMVNQRFLPHSPYLNIYQFPEELDYHDTIEIPANYVRVDSYALDEPEKFELPEVFKAKMKPGDKLVYLSLGSMGSCDVPLMKRLIATLAKTSHWYIVSCGLLHQEYELAENMWGEPYLPQTSILPLVDLVITHGGNNTLTETLAVGKPMLVMPLFYDQFNNAARVEEKGFGVYLAAHHFTEKQLIEAVDRLLQDKLLAERLAKVAQRIANGNSKLKACLQIEKIVTSQCTI